MLHVAADALNDALALVGTTSTRPAIELLPNNIVVVRWGVLHGRVALPRTTSPAESPRLTLTLASTLVALTLKAVVHRPFIHIHGRHLTIELARVPALAPWRDLWKHLEQLTFETAPGELRVGLLIAVIPTDMPTDNDAGVYPGAVTTPKGTNMRAWFEAQLATGFPALSGSTVEGTLALSQELLNELLAKWLAETQRPEGVMPRLDLRPSLRFLRSAAVRAEPGTVLVDFKIAV
jgi:hypothetical protein